MNDNDTRSQAVEPESSAEKILPTFNEPAQPVALSLPKRRRARRRLIISLSVVLLVMIIAAATALIWYSQSLRPVDAAVSTKRRVEITAGMTPQQIGTTLKKDNLIRNELSFQIYLRLNNKRDSLQAGVFGISPSQSVSDITRQLSSGESESFSITLFPGATLRDYTDKPNNQKLDVTSVLKRSGYSESDIKQAFEAVYNDPAYSGMFAGKPSGSSLEGYIYGETYQFSSGASAQDVVSRSLRQFNSELVQYQLEDGFKKQGLNLFEGITMASIVQREVSNPADQPQVAQVFLDRLKNDMPLGSDVTYQYAAFKAGVDPTPLLKSPYNTRIVKGLPPGPIAVPGLSALKAVANPASGNYVYFLSGDDDNTYFSNTLAEHEKNIIDHCAVKCSTN